MHVRRREKNRRNRTGELGQVTWEDEVRDGRRDEGPAEGESVTGRGEGDGDRWQAGLPVID